MTVSYTHKVTTSKGISCFLKLLTRWKGSIYKILWPDLFLFLSFYYCLSLSYRFVFDDSSKRFFEKLVKHCDKYANVIPLSFVLGFYVDLIMSRWWKQYKSIPFPDNIAILIGASIQSQFEKSKIIRRTIVRYVCLTFTITLRMISPKIKKRFPTFDHLIDAGLLTNDEKRIFDELDDEFPSYSKYWLPLSWSANIVTNARMEGFIRDDDTVATILEEINLFRQRCARMLDYDWISIPLVYTQVVTLAVYGYFIIRAIGQQFIEKNKLMDDGVFYFPFITVLEFFFYMGWLKVAETLINPFGEDDDDFEVVWMIDRHLQVCYIIVDRIHQSHPELVRDHYWFETAPNVLPFTKASKNFMNEYFYPSTYNVTVSKSDQDLLTNDDNCEIEINEEAHDKRKLWQKKKKKVSMPLLKQVVSSSSQGNSNVIDGGNEALDVKNQSKTINNCEEFENLKFERQQLYKKKLMENFQLLSSTRNFSSTL